MTLSWPKNVPGPSTDPDAGKVLALELVEQRPGMPFQEGLARVGRRRKAALQVTVVAQQADGPALGQRQAPPDGLVARQRHHQRQHQRHPALPVQHPHAHREDPVLYARTVAHAPDDRLVAGQGLAEILAEYRVVDMRGRRRGFVGGAGDQGAVWEKGVDAGEVRVGRLIAQQAGAHHRPDRSRPRAATRPLPGRMPARCSAAGTSPRRLHRAPPGCADRRAVRASLRAS